MTSAAFRYPAKVGSSDAWHWTIGRVDCYTSAGLGQWGENATGWAVHYRPRGSTRPWARFVIISIVEPSGPDVADAIERHRLA